MRSIFAVVAAAFVCLGAGSAVAGPNLPDPNKTPGDAIQTVPDWAAECISQKMGKTVSAGDAVTKAMICASGYTKCIRKVPESEKTAVFKSYDVAGNHKGYCTGAQGCEIDHLISLELGGSNDQKNLWPESYDQETWGAHVKDQLENDLHRMVCSGQISLKDAQDAISGDWIAAYKKYHDGQ